MMGLAALLTPLLAFAGQASLTGTVRSSADGAPVAAALVQLPEARRSVISGPRGDFTLTALDAGRYELRISRSGFRTRTLAVLIAAGDSLRLDITLEPSPIPIAPIAVRARLQVSEGEADVGDASPVRELGVRTLSARRMASAAALGQPDALELLGGAPNVSFDPERGGSFHVLGGETSQNLVLLDGAPVYAPYHFSGTAAALDADALDVLELHAGVPSAAWGGMLSGLVRAQTREPDLARVRTRGTVVVTYGRLAADGPLVPGHAGFLVSMRRQYPAVFSRPDDSHIIGSSEDVLGKVTNDDRWGHTELLVFRSSNSLTFPAIASADLPPGSPDRIPRGGTPDRPLHQFAWRGGTYALRWEGLPRSGYRLSVQAWHAEGSTGGLWHAPSRALQLSSEHQGDGVRATWTHLGAAGTFVGGVDLQRGHVFYAVEPIVGNADSLIDIDARTRSASAFVEHRLSTGGGRWETSVGLRSTFGSRMRGAIEPRLALGYHLSRTVSLGLGASRTYQPIQSLDNAGSLLSGLLAMDLPVSAGARGAPVARADQLLLELNARPNERTHLSVEGYLRALDGLALVEPATGLPFAADRFLVGSGHAAGVGLGYEHTARNVWVDAAYSLGVTTRRVGDQRYDVGFQARHAMMTSVGVRPLANTTFQGTLRARSGNPTSTMDGRYDWEACDPFNSGCEAAGSPLRRGGSLNDQRLPANVRVDVSARRDWTLRVGSGATLLGTYVSVANVFARRNVWAYTAAAGSSAVSGVPGRGRSLLSFGVDWRF